MYSTVGLLKNAKHSGRLVGTHQTLDRVSRVLFSKLAPEGIDFPETKEIIYFEGIKGPDGLKRKSPGVDEPTHFIIPDDDGGVLIKEIMNRQHNLRQALLKGDRTRSAFEAAWLAHALTDGLTPAHHFPYQQAVEELMTDKEYVTIFGQPVKGIMRGQSLAESARNNWLYWGVEGIMSKHIAFEYGAAIVAKSTSTKGLTPRLSAAEVARLKRYSELDLKREFYATLSKIDNLKMYDRFRKQGWTAELALETKEILLPEIVKMVTVGWLASLPTMAELEKAKAQRGKDDEVEAEFSEVRAPSKKKGKK